MNKVFSTIVWIRVNGSLPFAIVVNSNPNNSWTAASFGATYSSSSSVKAAIEGISRVILAQVESPISGDKKRPVCEIQFEE